MRVNVRSFREQKLSGNFPLFKIKLKNDLFSFPDNPLGPPLHVVKFSFIDQSTPLSRNLNQDLNFRFQIDRNWNVKIYIPVPVTRTGIVSEQIWFPVLKNP